MKPTYLNRFICLLLLLFAGTPWALQAQNPPPEKVCIVKNCLYERAPSVKDLLYNYTPKTFARWWVSSQMSPRRSEVIVDSYENAFLRLFRDKHVSSSRYRSFDIVTDMLASMLEKDLVAQGCQVQIVNAVDWTKLAREITHSRYISFMTALVVGQTPGLTAALRKETGADVIVYLDANKVEYAIEAKSKVASSLRTITGDGRVSMAVTANIAYEDIPEKASLLEAVVYDWEDTPFDELERRNVMDDVMACSQKVVGKLVDRLVEKPIARENILATKKKVCIVSNTRDNNPNFGQLDKYIHSPERSQPRMSWYLADSLIDIENGMLRDYFKFHMAYQVFASKRFSVGRDVFSRYDSAIPYLNPTYLIDYMTFYLKMEGYDVSVYFPWDIVALAKQTGTSRKLKETSFERGVVIDEPLLAALRKATGAETIIIGEGIHYDVDIKSERSKEDAVTGFSKMDLSYKTTIYQQGQPAKENLFEGDFETHWDGMTRDQVWQVYELPLMYQQCIEEITGRIRTTYKDI